MEFDKHFYHREIQRSTYWLFPECSTASHSLHQWVEFARFNVLLNSRQLQLTCQALVSKKLQCRNHLPRCAAILCQNVHVSVILIMVCLYYFHSGPAAFRGKIGDCEPRSLSGNHREVHLPTQVQKGEDFACVCVCV